MLLVKESTILGALDVDWVSEVNLQVDRKLQMFGKVCVIQATPIRRLSPWIEDPFITTVIEKLDLLPALTRAWASSLKR
jgi:hypothetical protein